MSSAAGQTLTKHLLIGLTGGIGSGKSTVAAMFEKLGARVIDTDEISRELTCSGGAAIAAIRDVFGTDFIEATGALDRYKMREEIFANPVAKQQLETILHPLILKQARQLAESPTLAPYTVVAIPLLFETQCYRGWLQRTLAIDCTEDTQIARTMQRSGLPKALVQTIMTHQIARSQRLALADDIIRNDSDLSTLAIQVERLHRRFLQISNGSD